MGDVCTDGRFDLIERFKRDLVEATNIETSPEEMAVLDSILFRMWQMGWLDKLAAPRWVRCEEKPKEDGDYLTYYVDGYCAVNHWSKGWGWLYDEEAVRYWIPIEPPQEDA